MQPFRWMHSFRPAGHTPDGKSAVVAAWGLILYDLADGKESGAPPEPRRRGEAPAVIGVSRDGKTALVGDDKGPLFRLVELPGLKPVTEFRGHEGGLIALRLSPDGSAAASAGVDGTVRLWDTRTGRQRHSLLRPGEEAYSLAFSHGGGELIFGSKAGLRVHDTATGKRLRTLPAGPVASIAGLPGGRLLVGLAGGHALVLRASDGKELVRLHHGPSLCEAAASPEGRRAATVGVHSNAVKVWCLDTGRLLGTLEGHIVGPVGACFSPDGTHLLTGDSVSTLRLWKVGRCPKDAYP
jgi:WD40 repeat protein